MTKRILVIIMALVLGLTPLVSASAMIGPQYVNTANGKGLYMRTGPSKDYDIIITIPFGAQVDSYEYYNNSWGYVSYRGYYGYCMSRYFSSYQPTKPTPAARPAANPSGATGKLYDGFYKVDYYAAVRPSTPSGYVNMRWAPSKDQAIQSTYYAGYSLHVLEQNDTWAQVYDDATGTSGFIMLAFLNTAVMDS